MLWNFNMDLSNNRVTDGLKSLWDESTRKDSPLHKLCAMVPRSLPHVHSLYISIQSWIDPPSLGAQDDGISYVESIILGPVEDMLRLLEPGPSKEFNVAIQKGAWFVLLNKYNKLYGPKLRVESQDGLIRGRFWKSLGLSSSQRGDPVDPFGYWICGGWNDIEYVGYNYWTIFNWGYKWTGVPDTF